MKKNLLLIVCLFTFLCIKAQRPFITTWNTASAGVSGKNQILFHATGSNYTVSWINMSNAADSGIQTINPGDTITFASQGIYKVYISPGKGTFSAFWLYGHLDPASSLNGDYNKLLSIEQWGDVHWSSFHYAFAYSGNLEVNATDAPYLAFVRDVSNMFDNCSSIKVIPGLNNWDMSTVTNISYMFSQVSQFNQPLDKWNVSQVTDMSGLFQFDTLFNQSLSSWNVSNVTNMSAMFLVAKKFNQPLNIWDVSNVTAMGSMFYGAATFNQSIENWNVSKVLAMGYMFANMQAFDQPLNKWNVSNVTDMSAMFKDNTSFNQPLEKWDVSSVDNMAYMFLGTHAFNQPIDSWNVHEVRDMRFMFDHAAAFNQPIGNWDVSNVQIMLGMFQNNNSFKQPVGNWDVRNTYDFREMFYRAHAFNQNLGAWNLGAASYTANMFDSSGMNCTNYSLTLKGWADSIYTPNGLSIGVVGLIYDSLTAKAAHDSLENVKGWTLVGDSIGNCSGAMPVTFLSFNTTLQNGIGLLHWIVGEETNVKGYNVERSMNGVSFSSIDFVKADAVRKGNYDFIDNELISGINYYRIKEMDNDGKFMLSSISKINYSKFVWKVNGNPINNTSVSLTLDRSANIRIQVISSNGVVVKTIDKGKLLTGVYNIPLDINNLSHGIYLVRLTVNEKDYVSTVIK